MCVPAPGREEKDILVLEVANTLRPRLDDGPVAICQERVLERDARIKLLANEQVTVVQSRGIEANKDFLWARRGLRYFFELEAGGEWNEYLAI